MRVVQASEPYLKIPSGISNEEMTKRVNQMIDILCSVEPDINMRVLTTAAAIVAMCDESGIPIGNAALFMLKTHDAVKAAGGFLYRAPEKKQ